jgi:hypothetical protein
VTRAVCIACGADKIGAFTPCFECRFDPSKPFDKVAMARSLVLSDHHQDAAGLDDASAVLRSGRALKWPDDDIARIGERIETEYPAVEREIAATAPAPSHRAPWILLVISVLILAGLVAFLAR